MKLPAAILFILCIDGWSQSNRVLDARGTLSLQQALESTLAFHPQLHLQEEQVKVSRGMLLQASSQFDMTLQASATEGRAYLPLDSVTESELGPGSASSTITDSLGMGAGGTQLFRNGMSFGPTVTLNRTADNLATTYGANRSQTSLQLTVPLLRGAGRDVVTANEKAAGLGVDASVFDVNQTMADLLANTALAYWNLVSTERLLEVLAGSEARGKAIVENVATLIAADQIPRSDLAEVSANLAQRTGARIAAEQQVVSARQQLALAMGLPQDRLLSLPDPADPLPVASTEAIPLPEAVPQFINMALTRRADLMSLKRRALAADTLVLPAKNSLKPQVNLVFTGGYSGYREGNTPGSVLLAPFVGAHGPDVSGGITYSFPLGNRNAIGAVMQAEAGSRQAQLRIDDAARTASSNVIVAYEALRSTALQLERAREAVRLFQSALDNEREKYRLGVSSLIDILTVEDRLTGSLTAQVQADGAYASALAQLRSATGTIVEPDRQVQSPDASRFARVPTGPGKP